MKRPAPSNVPYVAPPTNVRMEIELTPAELRACLDRLRAAGIDARAGYVLRAAVDVFLGRTLRAR
jgi:hypothetical protein